MCLSYSNFHSFADNCCKATWSPTELPLAFHGKDNWECLGLYHRNHKNKGFNGDGHSPGLVISRCVACVLAIHAQVLGVWAQRLDGRAPPAMCMATHRQHTADEQPRREWTALKKETFKSSSLPPLQTLHRRLCLTLRFESHTTLNKSKKDQNKSDPFSFSE